MPQMIVPPSDAWKLALALALCVAICVSAFGHAPRRSIPTSDLRRLVLVALALYGAGALVSLGGHTELAGLLYAAGIATCALALWLSRGTDSEDPPPRGDDPVDEQPPPKPDGIPWFDWPAFEREFRAYSQRPHSGVR
jgi:hypothetical protein